MYALDPFSLPAGYGEAILPLADVKRHVAVEDGETEFDEELAAYRDAAVLMVENYTGLVLGPRTGMVWRAERLPSRLRLGVRPVTALTEFTFLDGEGEEQEVDVDTLRIGAGGEVLLKAGQSWPSGMGEGLQITFNAGLPANGAPQDLVNEARRFAAFLFENRESVITGTISAEIPLGFRHVCAAYRPVI